MEEVRPMTTRRDPPLTGLTVLEVGAFMAAPYAGMQLADLGAQVLKIENPADGDPVRAAGPFVEGESSPFVRLNRGKRSVTLDLKSAVGAEAFSRLAATADVLIENMRPGTMRRLGFGYEDLRQANPALIYASVSGWGQDGPLSPLPGLDIMAQARGGLMSVTGYPGGEPVKVGIPICDLACGLYVALAVTAAVWERERSGTGQYIDVSLLESGVSLAVWEAGMYFGDGTLPQRHGSAHQSTAPYQAVRVLDGNVTIGATTPKTWRGLCTALGLEDLHDDPRYATSYTRRQNREELIETIERVTSQKPAAELIAQLDAAGVPCAPIADYSQVFNDPHLQHRGFFWDAPHPAMGKVRQIGSPMRFSRTPVSQGQAGPPLGEATREVLAGLGYADADIDRMVGALTEERRE
jgi:formyl-CoA transferase